MSDDVRVPFWSGATEWADDRVAVHEALDVVAARGRWILGPEVEAFEVELARWIADDCHSHDAVGVASGTDAVMLALRAVGVRDGDEVVVPALTAIPTVAAIANIGAVPVYADVDPLDAALDSGSAKAAITSRTRAIVHVHLHGRYRRLPVTRPKGVALVEDCAQAFGAVLNGVPAGSIGNASAFSFYPTKPLGGLGDGGAVVSPHREVVDEVRRLRQYGYEPGGRHWSYQIGTNSRLDEVHASWLRVRLAKHRARLAARAQIASWYADAIDAADADGIVCRPRPVSGEHPAWYHYVVTVSADRDVVRNIMRMFGVETAVSYEFLPAQMQPWRYGYVAGQCPFAEGLADSMLALPLWIGMSQHDVEEVVAALISSARQAAA